MQVNLNNQVPFIICSSPVAGYLTSSKDTVQTTKSNAVGFVTYRFYLRGIPEIFGDLRCPWARSYSGAKVIFSGPQGPLIRGILHTKHVALYETSGSDTTRGVVSSGADFLRLLKYGIANQQRMYYTYVLTDSELRFSETGFSLKDIFSKHALHADVQTDVRFAGEFCIQQCDVTGVSRLCIDNNSGTYSPPPALLPLLHRALVLNFPALPVETLNFDDPRLPLYKQSSLPRLPYLATPGGLIQLIPDPHSAWDSLSSTSTSTIPILSSTSTPTPTSPSSTSPSPYSTSTSPSSPALWFRLPPDAPLPEAAALAVVVHRALNIPPSCYLSAGVPSSAVPFDFFPYDSVPLSLPSDPSALSLSSSSLSLSSSSLSLSSSSSSSSSLSSHPSPRSPASLSASHLTPPSSPSVTLGGSAPPVSPRAGNANAPPRPAPRPAPAPPSPSSASSPYHPHRPLQPAPSPPHRPAPSPPFSSSSSSSSSSSFSTSSSFSSSSSILPQSTAQLLLPLSTVGMPILTGARTLLLQVFRQAPQGRDVLLGEISLSWEQIYQLDHAPLVCPLATSFEPSRLFSAASAPALEISVVPATLSAASFSSLLSSSLSSSLTSFSSSSSLSSASSLSSSSLPPPLSKGVVDVSEDKTKTWKRQHFAFQHRERLCFYDDPSAPPRLSVALSSVVSLAPSLRRSPSKPHLFLLAVTHHIVGKPQRTLHLSLHTFVQFSAWLDTLRQLAPSAVVASSALHQHSVDDAPRSVGPHQFHTITFTSPTNCDFCGMFIWGVLKQGSQCRVCGFNIHKPCKKKAGHLECQGKYVESTVLLPTQGSSDALPSGSGPASPPFSYDSVPLTPDMRVPPSPGRSDSGVLRHNFLVTTFTSPTDCDQCKKFIWGLVRQGSRCETCGLAVHKPCISAALLSPCTPKSK